MLLSSFLVVVSETPLVHVIQSATTLTTMDMIHMAKYGNAERNPFWKEAKNVFKEGSGLSPESTRRSRAGYEWVTYGADAEVQNLLHVGGQLNEQRLVAVVLAHVRDQDGPEGHRLEHRHPRDWGRLRKEEGSLVPRSGRRGRN